MTHLSYRVHGHVGVSVKFSLSAIDRSAERYLRNQAFEDHGWTLRYGPSTQLHSSYDEKYIVVTTFGSHVSEHLLPEKDFDLLCMAIHSFNFAIDSQVPLSLEEHYFQRIAGKIYDVDPLIKHVRRVVC